MMLDLTQKLSLKTAWDYEDPKRPSRNLPLVYGDMSQGGEGGLWEAVNLDKEGLVYALAGHPLLPVAAGNQVSLYDKDNNQIDGADYSLDLAHDFQGKGLIASVTFNEDPTELEPIGVRAQGKADDSGVLIENPVEIARDILLGPAGAREDELDAVSFSRAAARARFLGFAAAGVVSKPPRTGDVITGLLGEFLGSWWKNAQGKVKVVMDLGPGSLVEAELTHVFRPEHLKSVAVEAEADDLVNSIELSYALNHLEDEFEAKLGEDLLLDQKSSGLFGLRSKELSLEWVRAESAALAVGQRLLELSAQPRRVIECEEDALIGLHLEKGDAAIFSLPWLCDELGRPLKNQIVRVLSLEPQLDKGSLRYSLLDLGCCKTLAYPADGSHIAQGEIQGGGARDLKEY